jgi:hypothetical protein
VDLISGCNFQLLTLVIAILCKKTMFLPEMKISEK